MEYLGHRSSKKRGFGSTNQYIKLLKFAAAKLQNWKFWIEDVRTLEKTTEQLPMPKLHEVEHNRQPSKFLSENALSFAENNIAEVWLMKLSALYKLL